MEPQEFRCKWIDRRDLWKIAESVRESHWPEGTLPVDTEKIVEFRLRLSIEPKHGLFSAIDMDAYLKMDLTGIVVDHDFYMNDKFANRMRFSFAHELGHYFLHRDIISALKFGTAHEWKDFINRISEKDYRDFEWQANEFAGRLLVPPGRLRKEIERAYELIRKYELIQYLKTDPEAVLSRISPVLCKPFGVSTDVIETRARREDLWPQHDKEAFRPHTERLLCSLFSGRGGEHLTNTVTPLNCRRVTFAEHHVKIMQPLRKEVVF